MNLMPIYYVPLWQSEYSDFEEHKKVFLTAQKNQFTGESIRIEPVEGNILLFSSYLPHAVETNDHDEERISISFNVIALSKGSIEYSQSQE